MSDITKRPELIRIRKVYFKELKDRIKALEDEVKELKDLVDSFDWEIRGNHALTGTCTRLTDDQIKLLGGGE